MTACLFVGLGGALGSMARYLIGLIPLQSGDAFPYKTLLVNVVGAFVIGLIAALAAERAELDPKLVLFLKTGLCGGFTTFSTFALESQQLLQQGRAVSAAVYVVLSVVLSIAAVCAAQSIVR